MSDRDVIAELRQLLTEHERLACSQGLRYRDTDACAAYLQTVSAVFPALLDVAEAAERHCAMMGTGWGEGDNWVQDLVFAERELGEALARLGGGA